MQESQHGSTSVLHVLFLGTCVPERMCHQNTACSAAANNFQLSLMRHLLQEYGDTFKLDAAVLVPAASYPKGKHLLFTGGSLQLLPNLWAYAIPYINIEPAKSVTASVGFFVFILWKLITRTHAKNTTILTYNLNPCVYIPAVVIGRLGKIPVIPIVADMPAPGSLTSPTPLRRFDSWLQRVGLRYATAVIVLARAMYSDFALHLPHLHIPGGIAEDLVELHPTRRSCGENLGKKSILYAGGLEENGGVRLIIEAFKFDRSLDYDLFITGRGRLEDYVKAEAKEDNRIRFLGFVSRPAYLQLLVNSTLLINPRPDVPESRYSFPSKLLEYVASGRPTISTSASDVATDFRDTVILLRENTPEDLACLLAQLYDTPDDVLDDRGQKARLTILNQYNWSRQAQRIFCFITELSSVEQLRSEQLRS